MRQWPHLLPLLLALCCNWEVFFCSSFVLTTCSVVAHTILRGLIALVVLWTTIVFIHLARYGSLMY